MYVIRTYVSKTRGQLYIDTRMVTGKGGKWVGWVINGLDV